MAMAMEKLNPLMFRREQEGYVTQSDAHCYLPPIVFLLLPLFTIGSLAYRVLQCDFFSE